MSDSDDRCTNYLRIISTVVDLGTETVLEVFYHHRPRNTVKAFLSECTVRSKLEELKRRKILKLREFNLVNSAEPNPDEFDLNLLMTLLSNLFRNELQEPKNGWETFPPASDDLSTGADLLRLRRIRNDIVGHRAKAQLSTTVFMNLWTETEAILLRMISVAGPKKERELKYRLTVDKTKVLDTRAVQNALEKVQLWYDAVIEVQKKVDDLAKGTEALHEFYQDIPQQYRQYYTLLVDGGRMVLVGVWNRESQKYGNDANCLLRQNRQRLTEDTICAKLQHQLFPQEGEKLFNASELDISVLASVLICLFKTDLDTDEEEAIDQLRKARDDYADAAFCSNDTFRERLIDLIMNLRTLSAGLSREKQKEVNDFIKRFSKSTKSTNSDRCLEELAAHGDAIKGFSDIYKETMIKFREALKQMEEEGIPFGEEKVVVLKMFIRGSSQENSELAESIVESLIKKALQMTNGSSGYQEIRKAVDRILEHIQNIDGASLMSSERGCILLAFKCDSYTGLFGLLDYFESSQFTYSRSRLQEELCCHFKCEFEVRGYFTQESKRSVLENLDDAKKRKEEGYIPLRIACTTSSALREVHKLFTSEADTSNMINDAAYAISKELNDNCSVEIKMGLSYSLLSVLADDSSPFELNNVKETCRQVISPTNSRCLKSFTPLDTNRTEMCLKQSVLTTDESPLPDTNKLSCNTMIENTLHSENTLSTVNDQHSNFMTDAVEQTQYFSDGITEETEDFVQDLPVESNTTSKYNTVTQNMQLHDTIVGDGTGANLSSDDWEKIKKVRRLRELYHGRFTSRETTTLLRHHDWDMIATTTFILDALPSEIRDVLGEDDLQVVVNVRRSRELQEAARLNRIGHEVRQYGSKEDDHVWWRRVPSRKLGPFLSVNKCTVQVISPTNSRCLKSFTPLDTNRTEMCLKQSVLTTDESPLPDTNKLSCNTMIENTLHSENTLSTVNDQHSNFMTDAVEQTQYFSDGITEETEDFVQDLPVESNTTSKYNTVTQNMQLHDTIVGDGTGANLSSDDWEKIKKVRRLRELYHGRFTSRETTTLLRHHDWDMIATTTFILDALPSEIRDVLGEDDLQVVVNVRRSRELQEAARLNRIGHEVRQYGSKEDDHVWWRRVPSRKLGPFLSVNKCTVQVISPTNSRCLKSFTPLDTNRTEMCLKQSVLTTDESPLPDTNKLSCNTMIENTLHSENTLSTVNDQHSNFMTDAVEQTQYFSDGITEETEDFVQDLPVESNTTSKYNTVTQNMQLHDTIVGDGTGANLSSDDWEKIKKVRRLRELYHGRFTSRETTTLLRHHDWDMIATTTFILDALPSEIRDVLGEDDLQVVVNVRRSRELQEAARLNRIGHEVRQYGSKEDDHVWWRRVPSRKLGPVSKCHTCKQKYEPIPRDQEWGWGRFECVCGNKYNAFAMMDISLLELGGTGKSKSLCYRCMSELCEPVEILPPEKRDRGRRPRRNTHRCTAKNCFNRYEPDPRSNEPTVSVCVHPNSLKGKVHGFGSDRHISTGSTVATFLSQGDTDDAYEPSLAGIDEVDRADEENA